MVFVKEQARNAGGPRECSYPELHTLNLFLPWGVTDIYLQNISRGSLECPGLSGIKCCIPDGSEPEFGFNPDSMSTNYVAAATPYDNGETTTGSGSELLSVPEASWSGEQPQIVQPLPGLNAANSASNNNIDQSFPQPEPLTVVASNLNGGGIDTVDTVFFDTNGAGLGFNLPDVGSTAMWN